MTHRGQDWAGDALLLWPSHNQPCFWAPQWPCNLPRQPLPACQHQMETLEERNGDSRKDSSPTVLAQAAIINTITQVLTQQIFTSHSSGCWEVQDQGVGKWSVWWGPTSWFVDGCLLVRSSHGLSLVSTLREWGETEAEREIGFSLFFFS